MIDPRISLAAQAPDLNSSFQMFQSALNNAQNRKASQQQLEQSAALQPGVLKQQGQVIDANTQAANVEAQNQNLVSIAATIPELRGFISKGDSLGALAFLQRRKESLASQGRNPAETDEAIQSVMSGNLDQLGQDLDIVEREVVSRGLTGQGAGFSQKSSAPRVDPVTGQMFQTVFDPNTGESKRIDIEGAMQPTQQQEFDAANIQAGRIAQTKQDVEQRGENITRARVRADKAIDQIIGIKGEVSNLDAAIEAIDQGAESGKLSNWFPSFRKSTIKLSQAANRLGLDVISATTFGALSEGELKLAMDTAVPRDLQPQDLKDWLVLRKGAKLKLSRELEKMAGALGSGNMTAPEYLKQLREDDPLGLGL